MGTAELACAALETLVASPQFEVQTVVTQPDRPQGRNLRLQASPVKRIALAHELPVLQPACARDSAFIQDLANLKPKLIVVAAYGQILTSELIGIPPHGCVNLHTSLLPKYRGAAPIQWAILNGDTETGVTIMKIVEQLDAGDILSQRRTAIGPQETSQELHDRLAHLGAELLLETLPRYLSGKVVPQPQDERQASYARKIRKADGQIDWTHSAQDILNRLRAFTPWPGAFTFLPREPQPLLVKIWQAQSAPESGEPGTVLSSGPNNLRVACGHQSLDLQILQREGGRRLPVRDFLAGHAIQPGLRFLTLP